jgi:hypothetical protein
MKREQVCLDGGISLEGFWMKHNFPMKHPQSKHALASNCSCFLCHLSFPFCPIELKHDGRQHARGVYGLWMEIIIIMK